MQDIKQAALEFMSDFQSKVAQIESLDDHLQQRQLLKEISKETTDACVYLPSYDQRQCALKLKEMEERLARPKKKFSFKSKFTPTQKPSAPVFIQDIHTLLDISENAIVIRNASNEFIKRNAEKEPKDVYIYDCQDCIIDISHVDIMAIHLRNLKRCILIGNIASGSLLAHECHKCLFSLGCQQFRIHESTDLHLYLYIPSHPIIENCNRLGFGRFSQKEGNKYDQVLDFNWHKKTMSPHWYLLETADPFFDFKMDEMNSDEAKSLLLRHLSDL